jgi:hypothetical protein
MRRDGTGFADLVRRGVLPAGPHTLLASATAISPGAGGARSGGTFQLALAEDEAGLPPTPVPLPPAAWAALAPLGALAVAGELRKRRVAR